MEMNAPEATDDMEVGWSFDLAAMKSQLSGDDDLQITIKAHLYVEHILMELLKLSLPLHKNLQMDRLNFISKAEICAASGAMPTELLPPIKILNSFRNRLAHNLHSVLANKDKKKIFDSFNKMARDLVLESHEEGRRKELHDVPFGRIYQVIIVLLDVGRQQYLKWQMQRKAAFENARRVLEETKEYAKMP